MGRRIDKNNVSIDHMIDNRLFEPQRLSHSYIEFDLSDLVKDIHGQSLSSSVRSVSKGSTIEFTANNMLRLALSKHSMPSNSSDEIKIRKGDEEIKFAGAVTYDDITISYTDWIGADIERIISAWDALRYNPVEGWVNPAYKYKKRGSIVQYSPDGNISRTWTVVGAWIKSVKYGDYDRGDASGHREIELTLSIDKAYPDQRLY